MSDAIEELPMEHLLLKKNELEGKGSGTVAY